MPKVVLREIVKSFRGVRAVDGLSVGITKGQALCLFGPSGCGKTTTLRLIAGLERLDEGAIRIDDTTVGSASRCLPPRDRDVGMVFQDIALWPHMNARKHLEFVMRGRGWNRAERWERAEALLRLLDLEDKMRRKPAELSGGECQRLAIGRALATDPSLLLLDEPFGHLDEIRRIAIIDELKRRKDNGDTIIFATHEKTETSLLADRVLWMSPQGYLEWPAATWADRMER